MTAALAHGLLVLGRPWHEQLRHAVALLGAATVAAPVAYEFSAADYARALGAGDGAAGKVRGDARVSRYRRWNDLLELLAAAGRLEVEDAAKALHVSAATVRRDFDELVEAGGAHRIRGAVAGNVSYDLPLRYKTERYPWRSSASARWRPAWSGRARSSASTAGPPPPRRPGRWPTRPDLGHEGTEPAVTVVTNALNMRDRLPAVGHQDRGHRRTARRDLELTGPLATGVLDQVTLDVAFLGVDAIDAVAKRDRAPRGRASINQLMARQAAG